MPTPTNKLYGFPQPTTLATNPTVIAKRAPTTADFVYPIGQLWVDQTNSVYYGLVSIAANVATWNVLANVVGGINTLTGTTGGALSPTAGNINLLGTANQIVNTGSGSTITSSLSSTLSIPGTMTVTGASTFNGLLTTQASANIRTGATDLNLGADAGGSTINLGTGSSPRTINIGTGALVTNTISIGGTGIGTIGIGNTQTAGSVSIGNGMTTGTISIGGTGLQTGTITFGGGTGAQTVNLGTGGTGIKTVNLGTGAIDNVVTIGSVTGAASLSLKAGTAGITLGGALNNIKTLATGAAAISGTATLASGTVTVNSTAITASSLIYLTYNTPVASPGYLSAPVASVSAGVHFVINSTEATDSTSTVNWLVVN